VAPALHAGLVQHGHRLDVGAGGEHPLAAVDHHGADVVALGRLLGGRADLPVQLLVDRVHLRAVQQDGAHPGFDLQGDELRRWHGGSCRCGDVVVWGAP
jgi:hypothetical protein